MASAPPVASSAFYSASPIYSRVEEGSANTPAPGNNRPDFDKGSNTELAIEDLSMEYQRELEAQRLKLEDLLPVKVESAKIRHSCCWGSKAGG
jgi:hypothetical protein